MRESFTVRDLPPSERPRERFLKFGIEALSMQELLALILGRGIKGESVLATSQNLLAQLGSLKNIANASISDLTKIKGIGLAKAAQIKAAFELGRRLETFSEHISQEKIKTPEDVIKSVKNKLKGKKKEHFIVLSLDTRNHLIDTQIISIGSLDSSIVHPREVFKEAISASAASVIFIHNHPSGDPEPSEDDIKLTKRLIEVGEILGIEVLDHIIICDNIYLSMKSRNLL
jgi:DNA repair protein RadC